MSFCSSPSLTQGYKLLFHLSSMTEQSNERINREGLSNRRTKQDKSSEQTGPSTNPISYSQGCRSSQQGVFPSSPVPFSSLSDKILLRYTWQMCSSTICVAENTMENTMPCQEARERRCAMWIKAEPFFSYLHKIGNVLFSTDAKPH